MREITIQEFAALCRSDPDLFSQMVAIPNMLTPDKVFALAEKNGYRIVQGRNETKPDEPVSLDMDQLDRVTGGIAGASSDEQWAAMHEWMYYVIGNHGSDHQNRRNTI